MRGLNLAKRSPESTLRYDNIISLRNLYYDISICYKAAQLEDIDIRVLLSGLKYKNLEYIKTTRPIDLVIFDKQHAENDIHTFIKNRIKSITEGYKVLTTDTGTTEELSYDTSGDSNLYKHTVLGGTFDRLHIAHKLLLTEAALRASEKITVGVTDENMIISTNY